MRVPTHEFIGQSLDDIGEIKGPRFFGDPSMEDDLPEQIPQLVAQIGGIPPIDGVDDLVGLLKGIRGYAGPGLSKIPRAPRLRIP